MFQQEKINWFIFSDIIHETISKWLRKVFKEKWLEYYGRPWTDSPSDGQTFYEMENFYGGQTREHKPDDQVLRTIKTGNSEKWDCTVLCHVILFLHDSATQDTSRARPTIPWHPKYDYAGWPLNPDPVLCQSVCQLRNIRNAFMHAPNGKLSDDCLRADMDKVGTIFRNIGRTDIARQIQDRKQQLKSFTPEERMLKRRKATREEKHKLVRKSFCVLPLSPAHGVTFRKREVGDIIARLNELQTTHCTDGVTTVYISGNPGCGKSQVARQVGEELHGGAGNTVLEVIATIKAENSITMLESLAKLASDLGCSEEVVSRALGSTNPSDVERSLRVLSNCVRCKLNRYSSWLLIIDNIDKCTSYKDYWPQPGETAWGRGQVMVTTQDAATVPCDDEYADHVSLSKGMNEDDAIELLESVSGLKKEDRSNINEVVKRLDKQPLALASAALYIKKTSSVSWKDYIEKLKRGELASTEKVYENANASKYPNAMTTAVMMSSQAVWDCDPVFKKAFRFLAFCAPEQPVPLHLLIQYVINSKAEVDDGDAHENLDEGVVAEKLTSCSLLLIVDDKGVRAVSRHQVFQQAFENLAGVKQRCKLDEVSAVSLFLPDILMSLQAFYEPLHNSWDPCGVLKKRLLFHHLQKIIEIHAMGIDLVAITKNVALTDCLQRLGDFCQAYDKHTTAQILYKCALNYMEESCGRKNPKVGVLKNALGKTYLYLDNLDEAEKLCNETLEILKSDESGEVNCLIVKTLTNLGLIYEKKGDFTKSIDFIKKAVHTLHDHPTSDPTVKAGSLGSLGTLYFRLGEYREAVRYTREAVDLLETENHPNISKSLTNLGFFASELGELTMAEQCTQKSLYIAEAKFDSSNHTFGYIYCNIGIVKRRQGELAEAKRYSLEACHIFKECGISPLELVEATDYLGMVHYQLGELKEAKDCHEKAIKTWTEKTNARREHPILGRFEQNLGRVHEANGDLESAKEHYERSLKTNEASHPKVADTHDRIGYIERKLGNLAKAQQAHKRALRIREKRNDELGMAESYYSFGIIAHKQRKLDEAKRFYQDAMATFWHKLGAEHPKVADCKSKLGLVFSEYGEFTKAEEYLENAMAMRKRTLGAHHHKVAQSLGELGNLQRTKHTLLKSAKSSHERALKISEDTFGRGHWQMVTHLRNLALTCCMLGYPNRAKQLLREAAGIRDTHPQSGHVYKVERENMLKLTRHSNTSEYQKELGRSNICTEYY